MSLPEVWSNLDLATTQLTILFSVKEKIGKFCATLNRLIGNFFRGRMDSLQEESQEYSKYSEFCREHSSFGLWNFSHILHLYEIIYRYNRWYKKKIYTAIMSPTLIIFDIVIIIFLLINSQNTVGSCSYFAFILFRIWCLWFSFFAWVKCLHNILAQ